MSDRLHGVEVVNIDVGARVIQTPRASVIGLIGTATDADADKFPLNTPVLIAGQRRAAAALGARGTLAAGIDSIFDQTGAMVVVIRVDEGENAAATLSNVIGGVDAKTGKMLGLQAFLGAKSSIHVTPRLLIAPSFSHQKAVATEMIAIADRLKGIAILDGPNVTDKEAIAYRKGFGSARAYLVDPWVKVWDTAQNKEVVQPISSRVAGLIAKSDSERGFWTSPSNQEIAGIIGLARDVDFAMGDKNSRANILNNNEVTTVIHEFGYRLWGNRTLSSDPKWAFINKQRTADMIGEAVLQSHLWAVDRNITRTYLEDVIEGVSTYLRDLKARGVIVAGEAWADPELNTASKIDEGHVTIDFDFSLHSPAERITFRSILTNKYLSQVLPLGA